MGSTTDTTAKRIFVLTGAGVSAESGLGTFRERGGMWSRFDPMTLATPEAFAADPARVQAFYNLRRRGVIEAAPNAAHRALARLEAGLAKAGSAQAGSARAGSAKAGSGERGGGLFLCTQNVDDLHERAGSRAVVHMHGELLRARCLACAAATPCRGDLGPESACPACGTLGRLRPDVVWFGEVPKHLATIEAALEEADLFVAIGTSGAVYPAAGYAARARALGIRTLELNLEPSDNAGLFDAARRGPASAVVPAWVDELLG